MIKILGIIGDPISHSLSPQMHTAALRRLRLPYRYLPFHVKPAELGRFIQMARECHLAGLNVTIPHKEKIIRYLDGITDEARRIGAVNTVFWKGKRLLGDNTDARGYLHSLKEDLEFSPRRKTVLILGAGGAARAIVDACLATRVRRVILANRTLARAKVLSHHARQFWKTPIEIAPLKAGVLKNCFPDIDLLINTTSVGLSGSRFHNLPLHLLPKKAVVSDLVYRPRMTPLLREARQRGFRVHEGLGMLLHQGALSFQIWTGQRPPLKIMKTALLDALR